MSRLAPNTVFSEFRAVWFLAASPEAGQKNRRLINRGCYHVEKQTDHKQNSRATSLHATTSFQDGFLKQLADRILALQQECARVQGELTLA